MVSLSIRHKTARTLLIKDYANSLTNNVYSYSLSYPNLYTLTRKAGEKYVQCVPTAIINKCCCCLHIGNSCLHECK